LEKAMLVYFVAMCNIFNRLVCFMAIWYIFGHLIIFPRFGMLYQENFGNPGPKLKHAVLLSYWRICLQSVSPNWAASL
jgi:hypothetical protein